MLSTQCLSDFQCHWGAAANVNYCKALQQVTDLRDHFFVDQYTRVLFVDLNFYGASTKLHTLARFIFEFRLGAVYPS